MSPRPTPPGGPRTQRVEVRLNPDELERLERLAATRDDIGSGTKAVPALLRTLALEACESLDERSPCASGEHDMGGTVEGTDGRDYPACSCCEYVGRFPIFDKGDDR